MCWVICATYSSSPFKLHCRAGGATIVSLGTQLRCPECVVSVRDSNAELICGQSAGCRGSGWCGRVGDWGLRVEGFRLVMRPLRPQHSSPHPQRLAHSAHCFAPAPCTLITIGLLPSLLILPSCSGASRPALASPACRASRGAALASPACRASRGAAQP